MNLFRLLIMTTVCTAAQMQATTIIIKEINNELKATINLINPDGTNYAIKPLETVIDPIVITKNSQAENFETSPLIVSEGTLKLFELQFKRARKKSIFGKVEVTLSVLQDGKKLIAKKNHSYQYDQDTYMITLTIKPGKRQPVTAEPRVEIEAMYGEPELSLEDWQTVE